jgi:hypothetical protein
VGNLREIKVNPIFFYCIKMRINRSKLYHGNDCGWFVVGSDMYIEIDGIVGLDIVGAADYYKSGTLVMKRRNVTNQIYSYEVSRLF